MCAAGFTVRHSGVSEKINHALGMREMQTTARSRSLNIKEIGWRTMVLDLKFISKRRDKGRQRRQTSQNSVIQIEEENHDI